MNPLTVVQSYLEILLSDLQDGLTEQQLEFASAARSAALKLNRVVHQIVELASLELGVAELDSRAVDVGPLVRGVCEAHASEAETGRVELSTSIAPDSPPVRADPERLRSAIDAVVVNAVQWTPPGGRVEVVTSIREAHLVVSVTDAGPGIAEEKLRLVFEPFTRFSGKDGAAPRGLGLGLSVARLQIDAMGGGIGVTSSVGGGSRFEILMPTIADEKIQPHGGA
jgi:signal transduction histidine kinase